MPDILISELIRGEAVDALAARFDVQIMPDLWRDPPALAEHIANVRALMIRNQTQITSELLGRAKRLRVIGRAGVGLDNVDLAACARSNVIVTSTPDQNAISVAELAIALMLSLARSIPAADADTKKGNWNRRCFQSTEFYGKTFGIIGAGKIGLLTANRARAFGMHILAYDPYVSRDNVHLAELNAELIPLEDLLRRADVVSCHLPSTAATSRMLNGERFRLMKPSAYLINTSRGEVVDEDGLLEALRSKTIAGAALDVRSSEPPKVGELETLPNVLLTPHIAAMTFEAQTRVTRALCEDVSRVLDGEPPLNPVNLAGIVGS